MAAKTPACFDSALYKKLVEAEQGKRVLASSEHEGIEYRQVYSQDDRAALPLADTTPGAAPFTRGARASMYTGRPWTLRQYAGFSTAAASNGFYKESLAKGQRGLSIAFDLATHRGYDSDNTRVEGDVGKTGVAVDSVEDMKRLFDGIPLAKTSVSMTMNGAVLPILAAFIVAAEEQGAPAATLRGTIQNDILKEFTVRNTFIYPPKESLRIVADIIEHCSNQLPHFNPISISGYHMQEAGASAELELAFTLANGLEYVRTALAKGLTIDSFAPRLSFFFGIGMDFLVEVSKLRAARSLWAELIEQHFSPKKPESLRMRMHCQTSGVSLTAQDPLNNAVRTTIEAMAAVFGGTQSLHTNAYDEALALPSDDAARLARNTQLILQHETDICRTVDPLGGSYAIESLTEQLCQKARAIITQLEEGGGVVAAIESGWIQTQIERSAAARQARLDMGHDHKIGVNLYPESSNTNLELRTVDNQQVLTHQLAQLKALRASRDNAQVETSLAALESVALSAEGNLLEAAIVCMRARATVGEVTSRLEKHWGRHLPKSTPVGGVFASAYGAAPEWQELRQRVTQFEHVSGRKPRILVTKLGQDGHDRGSKVIASGFADAGFDVDLAPLFQTPGEAARVAIDNDVHVVGVSTQAGAHLTLLPQLIESLAQEGASDIKVVCGGIIPPQDYDVLKKAGVLAIFAPGTPVIHCAKTVIELLADPTS